MKSKNNSSGIQPDNLKFFNTQHNYQLLESYWKKRKKECEKNLSKFC